MGIVCRISRRLNSVSVMSISRPVEIRTARSKRSRRTLAIAALASLAQFTYQLSQSRWAFTLSLTSEQTTMTLRVLRFTTGSLVSAMIAFPNREMLRFATTSIGLRRSSLAAQPAAQVIRVVTQGIANVAVREWPVLPVTPQPVLGLVEFSISEDSLGGRRILRARNCVHQNSEHEHLLRLLIKICLKTIQSMECAPGSRTKTNFRAFVIG